MSQMPTNIDWMMELRGTIAWITVIAWFGLLYLLQDIDWNGDDDE